MIPNTTRAYGAQPTQACALARDNPLLKGVDFIFLGSSPFWNPGAKAIVRSALLPTYATMPVVGRAPAIDSSHYFSFPEQSASGDTRPWTIAGVFMPYGNVSTAQIVGTCESPGSGTTDRTINYDSFTDGWQAYLFDGAQKTATSSAVATPNKPDLVIATTNGSTLTIAVRGYPDVSVAVSNTGYTGYASAEFCLGWAGNNAMTNPIGVGLCLRSFTYWPASKRRMFFRNPWQIFETLPSALYYSLAASAATFKSSFARANIPAITGGARVL